MIRFHLRLAFDGSHYSGFQRQGNALTVQEALERQLFHLFPEKPQLVACSRTDAGVHALDMNVHFDVHELTHITPEVLRKALNRLLPPDITVLSARIAPETFHARFSPVGKTYCYVFDLTPKCSPFFQRYVCSDPKLENIPAMKKAFSLVVGTHDFSGLSCERKQPVLDHHRTMYCAQMRRYQNYLLFTISGSGFLYKMVRSIIGTVQDVGHNRFPPEIIAERLACTQKNPHVQTAVPNGLFLTHVHYQMPADFTSFTAEIPPFLNPAFFAASE